MKEKGKSGINEEATDVIKGKERDGIMGREGIEQRKKRKKGENRINEKGRGRVKGAEELNKRGKVSRERGRKK